MFRECDWPSIFSVLKTRELGANGTGRITPDSNAVNEIWKYIGMVHV